MVVALQGVGVGVRAGRGGRVVGEEEGGEGRVGGGWRGDRDCSLHSRFKGGVKVALRRRRHEVREHALHVRCELHAIRKPFEAARIVEITSPVREIPDSKTPHTVLEENCPRTGKRRKYWLNEISGDVRVEEVRGKASIGEGFRNLALHRRLCNFVLPAGFPNTVTDDYLQYMLYQLPVHVTGWVCSTLVTSTLLTAVGIGSGVGVAPVAAATAAIKWVTKDGIGALGRFIIGGRFGSMFDEDPKQWRMYADVIGSVGGMFELATPLAPGSFLLLASLGNLTKAVARGLKEPSTRVVQTHFAIAENVGDVAAKGEVWAVGGQLLGLGTGILLLRTPAAASYECLVGVWAAFRAVHLYLRYRSLKALELPTINFKRAALLAQAHVAGLPMPDVRACNARESLLMPRKWTRPRVQIGCSLETLLATGLVVGQDVNELLSIYEREEYVLVFAGGRVAGPQFYMLLKEGATSMTLLRSVWQAEWLLQNETAFDHPENSTIGRLVAHNSSVEDAPLIPRINPSSHSRNPLVSKGMDVKSKQLLSSSLSSMQESFEVFMAEAAALGWNSSKLVLRIPPGAPMLRRPSTSNRAPLL